ncbi:sensor histidine kinase [Pseudoduganella umbonata]|uniref:histidine kinase n=1 Tax=Pseudoduganella umbonata TaxID=864828 RepID=A0A4V1ECZ9_9BURK|nr:sensor histidine kinase [Pseudoduganella umbonata]MBB3219220.1 two-component system sensor histidine kinase TctE [Pseudoduganella umbonata]QCP09341.1 sensor histidine kinase [Pseudoduganella umbonata]
MPRPSRTRRAVDWSLRGQLVAWVLLPQLVLWVAGGVATYRLAVNYVNEAADATLSQAARTLARQVKPIGNGLLIDLPRAAQNILEADPNDRFLYTVSTPPGRFILGNNAIPLPPAHMRPRPNDPYFYDGEMPPDQTGTTPGPAKVRVAALFLKNGELDGRQQWMLVQVARGVAARESIWKRILVDTLLPLSALIMLMTVIVWAGTGAGLAPLLRLRREVEDRSPNDLTPLRADAAPRELRSLVRALNNLLAAVRQNVDAQKRFIADAAHQLRTPLAGVISHAELALGATSDPALVARLTMLHQSATRSAHLIARMLMLARTEPEAAMVQERSPVELGALVEQVVADAVPKALRGGADLGVGTQRDPAGLWVQANPMLLAEALVNILDNAIEYAGAGSEITVAVRRDGRHARISVSDNGPGIARADHARVFDRFVRATDQGLGCGLGLAIVHEIVTQHGGSVSLGDVDPHGLEVVVKLPLL